MPGHRMVVAWGLFKITKRQIEEKRKHFVFHVAREEALTFACAENLSVASCHCDSYAITRLHGIGT